MAIEDKTILGCTKKKKGVFFSLGKLLYALCNQASYDCELLYLKVH